MMNEKNQNYRSWGITAFIVIAAALILSYVLNHFPEVKKAASSFADILMPFVYGLVMTFLMSPMYNRIVRAFGRKRKSGAEKGDGTVSDKLARFAATAFCILFILCFLTMLVAMLLPQLIQGTTELVNSMPENVTSFSSFLDAVFHENEETKSFILKAYEQVAEHVNNWVMNQFLPNINKYFVSLTTGVMRVLGILKNFFIGIIIMAYGLNMKEVLGAGCKRILFSLLPINGANAVVEECRFIKHTFSVFIVGKLIDSLLIGIICYICMRFMKMPYSLVISVFVGITNVIPFFGPFIGAVPSAFIILLTEPIMVIPFVIFILVLQQFDGNILGPKILGSATGLSSFWVLFAILFFGGLWGIVGMIIGIPTFAVIARLVNRFVVSRLIRKDCRTELEDYDCLLKVEQQEGMAPLYVYYSRDEEPGNRRGYHKKDDKKDNKKDDRKDD